MQTLPLREVQASLTSLIAAVETGEEIALTLHGRVIARIVPEARPAALRRQRRSETESTLESHTRIWTELVAPLD